MFIVHVQIQIKIINKLNTNAKNASLETMGNLVNAFLPWANLLNLSCSKYGLPRGALTLSQRKSH